MIESIRKVGTITPALARPLPDGGYELISGHRRLAACQVLGIETMPVIVREMSDDEAVIAMVDANLQRETILPSEKAFAYKMKLDAIKHQGKTSVQVAEKLLSVEKVAEEAGESKDQVRRYIRLTYLIPELLSMVDEGNQRAVVDEIDLNQATPSHAQTIRMRQFFTDGKLTPEVVSAIMGEEKPNQREKIVLRGDKVRSLIPKNIPVSQTEDYVVKALEHYSRFLRQRAERDSR